MAGVTDEDSGEFQQAVTTRCNADNTMVAVSVHGVGKSFGSITVGESGRQATEFFATAQHPVRPTWLASSGANRCP